MSGKSLDEKFWGGGASKGSVFPMGVKHKNESSAEGAGSIMEYEDTTESAKKMQEHGIGKAKSHPLRAGYRY